MTSTKSSSDTTTTTKPDKSSKLLNLLQKVNTKSTSIQKSSNNDSKMKMPLTKKGIKKFKDKLKYTQKLKQLEMKKQLIKEMEKERTDKEKTKQINFQRNLQYFTFSAEKIEKKTKNNSIFKK